MVAAKKTDTPDAALSINDQVLKARARRQASDDVPPASIVNAQSDRKYSVIVTRDYSDKQLPAVRKWQGDRGYVLAESGEFMVGEPDAEIWAAPKEIGDDEWKDDFIRCLLDPNWVQLQSRRANHGIAKKVFELALKVHEADEKKSTPEARAIAKDALVKLVRATPIPDLQARY